MEQKNFDCTKCGLCCMNLQNNPLYNDLNRGDGICKFLDLETKLCSIYDSRPDKCNIDVGYEKYFKNKMSKEKYYQLNYEACNKLQESGDKKCF